MSVRRAPECGQNAQANSAALHGHSAFSLIALVLSPSELSLSFLSVFTRSDLELSPIEARELRNTCIHEASQVVVTRHFGGMAEGFVWRNPSGNVEGKAWLGRCVTQAPPGTISRRTALARMAGIARPPKDVHRLICLAGFVGQMMADDSIRDDANTIAQCLADALAAGEISDSDRAGIGDEWGLRDVATVVEILRARGHLVSHVAQSILSRAPTEPPGSSWQFTQLLKD